MGSVGYTTLTRQAGLLREMETVANNIANSATTGFRQEGLMFSEYIKAVDNGPSLSMAQGNIGITSQLQGTLTATGGKLDFAIEGEGFFLIETPEGERLTRAGNFAVSPEGDLVTLDGRRVLDAGGAPIFIPTDATDISAGPDGTLSAGGQPIGQLGVVTVENPLELVRQDGVLFDPSNTETIPAENPKIVQGFVEGSNVDPIGQIARMIQIQRAYELGQSFLEADDERVRAAIKTFVK